MGQKEQLRWPLTYQQSINKEMVIAAINPNLRSKYLLARSYISAPDVSITTQPFKAESILSNYVAMSRKIRCIVIPLKFQGIQTSS